MFQEQITNKLKEFINSLDSKDSSLLVISAYTEGVKDTLKTIGEYITNDTSEQNI